jgi:hypothetical protein
MERWAPWLIGAAFLLLYGFTAAPSIVALFDDTLEFQLVLPTFAIAHPTGYPLYTILGGLWSRLLPLGEWAGRVNLFSAASAAVAVGLLAAVAGRLARSTWPSPAGRGWRAAVGAPSLWAALTAALAFGLGPTWRAMATVAEVYALHGLFVALILLLTLRAADASQPERARAVLWVALAVGLSLAHHRTTLLLLPGVALTLLWSDPTLLRPQRAWLAWAAALLLPLALYLWLPLRFAMGARDLNAAYTPTWAGFWNHTLARSYSAFFSSTGLEVERRVADWFALAVAELGWVALALALVGVLAAAASALARRRVDGGAALRGWFLIGATLVANLAFALLYRVGDVEVFMLPVWLCAALFAGATVAWLVAGSSRVVQIPGAPALAGAALALLLLPTWAGRASAPQWRDDWSAHDYALALSAPAFPPGSQVIALEGEATALRYMQQALGRAPNAEAVVADDPALRRSLVEAAMQAGAPVWLTRELPGIESAYSFSAEGAAVRAWPRGEAAPPPPAQPHDLPFADGALTLVGSDVTLLDGAAGRQLRVGLHWLPTRLLEQDFKLSLRIVNSAGELLPLADGSPAQADLFPLRLVAPSSTWLPGERVRDEQLMPLPTTTDDASLLVILYDADTLAEAGRILLPLR